MPSEMDYDLFTMPCQPTSEDNWCKATKHKEFHLALLARANGGLSLPSFRKRQQLNGHLSAFLQDWHKLIDNYDKVVPTKEFIDGMDSRGREIAPLLASSQQKQIKVLAMQHHSRLQAQKQLNAALQHKLAAAGTSHKSAAIWDHLAGCL